MPAGFALVVTISMMVILVVVAVGLLGLSAISLNTSTLGSADANARANARMALMMAIDRLQLEMGPDQRISANGSILSEQASDIAHRHWTGAWDSWKANDTSPAGNDERSYHQTVQGSSDSGIHPSYSPQRQDHFRSWLVSGNPSDLISVNAAMLSGNPITNANRLPNSTHDAVILVDEGSLGNLNDPTNPNEEEDKVAVPLVSVAGVSNTTTGRYGWWVSDESQKATILHDSYQADSDLTSAEKLYRSQSPASTGTQMAPGLEQLTNDPRLASLPSRQTLDIFPDTDSNSSKTNFHSITTSSRGVLTDVREGGLKRDLSTILEQPIKRSNSGDEYMLYAFDDQRFPDQSNSRVPVQDLAAYYQMYDHESSFANDRREGVQYDSSALPDSLQIKAPDFDGGSKDRQRMLREYTALYRQPVITKVQFLVAVAAQPVTAEERQYVLDRYLLAEEHRRTDYRGSNSLKSSRILPMRDSDTYKLRMGIIPMVTLWNPNNIPLVLDSSQIMRFSTPPFGFRFRKFRNEGSPDVYDYNWTNLSYNAGNNFGGATTGQASGNSLVRLRFGANTSRNIVFEPGEVKVFSLPASTGSNLLEDGDVTSLISTDTNYDTANEWDPYGFFMIPNSTPHGAYEDEAPEAYGFQKVEHPGQSMVFNPNDKITFSIDAENAEKVASGSWRDGRYVSQARSSDPKGSGFTLYFMDEDYQKNWQDKLDHIRHYTMVSRHGNSDRDIQSEVASFNYDLIKPGFPGGEVPIEFDSELNATPCQEIIESSNAGEVTTLFEFSLHLGCELGTAASGGFGGGRRIASRPFLHSPLSAAPFIDQNEPEWLYSYGWDWMVGKVPTVEDSILQAQPETGNGYYGGGYTIEAGTTHVTQREIPVLPPISIASLSHAHLGGFSLAYAMPIGNDPDADTYFKRATELQEPSGLEYQRTTATGQAGLAPHITQAIGNSYAHPHIPADQAVTTKRRHFDADEGETAPIPFVDHSYLANKALWDDYFFSSITPQPQKVKLHEGSEDLTALQVAESFFDGSQLLPNRRLTPYPGNIDTDVLTELFDEASLFTNGLADKIASHLMVNGAFNVNSTSVNAWKVLLSSLRGKPVAYLTSGSTPLEITPEGSTFGIGMLSNDEPIQSSSISSPNTPEEQWTGSRELSDDEIDELARAIVKQVKLRGPFLSLSEFVNRRLEGNANTAAAERSAKGALQAALDDSSVSINSAFRASNRKLDAETLESNFDFPMAATGPIAYGSSAYVDQADILRSFAGQLTPRGDTFVIRAYGDSLDANGKVQARAWCEAIVQRVPEYTDSVNDPHLKQSELNESNKNFGRKFRLLGTRWLNPSEI